ncbi:topoisomerase [Janthinobacterium aquaticum]|uniref:topoisomerase n=1 Tax=Janthinobacterium sp. FT58W TaxID=2654254 RepID=UPI0012650A67|nr:topoisomerase [Janthinobacterium sp. FT58W]KAB8042572.1 topoisomerase [Janthinobacterium sp. FT58W]
MDFRAQLEAIGFMPTTVEPDGKWHRCKTVDHPKKRNGAYRLATCGTIGFYQNHATESEVTTWRAGSETERPDPMISQARMREALNERRRKAIKATEDARAYWRACKPLRHGHPYLDGKLLTMQGCAGLRVDDEGWLIVPVDIGGAIVSLQRISPDGSKRFWSGASVKGGCYVLDTPRASMTALVEGLATGLAVFQSVPNCRVIVAFDCGNMDPVARRLVIAGLAVVAADNDYATEARTGRNPGLVHGRSAAELIGCGIAWPEGIVGTDYADMLAELIASGRQANDAAPRRDQVRDEAIIKVAKHRVAQSIKRAMKFVAHRRKGECDGSR